MRNLMLVALCLIMTGIELKAQVDAPENGNPLVPGYFADPTIRKFGDTWYLYATTDGIKLASGDPQVWVSKDFKNWCNYKIELPNRKTDDVWAPEVVEGPDGRYYYYYSSCRSQYGGCNIFGYVSDTPIGPWESLTSDGSPVIPADFNSPIIPLDPNVFIDEDGAYYIYYCTWAVYEGHGVGWATMNEDMKSFSDKGIIPNTQLPDVFEAPFMMKKDGVYYLSYSAGSTHDGSYRVMYATSDSPTGTFTAGANNPVTITNNDGTIEAPGHHSFFMDGEDYYIAYHRHDNPHSTGGLVRQVCVDSLLFDNTAIQKVKLTHEGIDTLAVNQIPLDNLALTKSVTASSYYTDDVHSYSYVPENAVDDNNGTIWKAGKTDMGEWLQIDLGATVNVKRVLTDFEYPIYYYQYQIDYSTDGESWSLYADKTANKRCGSPMLDDGDIMARYLKITITGVQKPGLFPAIWNVRVYNDITSFDIIENPEQSEDPAIFTRGNKLVDIHAGAYGSGDTPSSISNTGTLAGTFSVQGELVLEDVDETRAFTFSGSEYLVLSKNTPASLTWNSPYTVSAWVYNPQIATSECIVSWAERGGPLGTYAALNYGSHDGWGATAHWEYPDMGYSTVPSAKEWHNIVVVFDGGVEKVYVDGVLNAMEQKNLYVHSNGQIRIGYSGDASETYSGYLASLQMYDYALTEAEITDLYSGSTCAPTTLYPEIKLEDGSLLPTWKVGVNAGTKVKLHPELSEGETDTGNWNWTGPNSFTASTRDIELTAIAEAEFGEYTVTYVNDCEISSSQSFTIEIGEAVLPDTYSSCSNDNETCVHIGKVHIAYGIPGNYFYVYDMEGTFECSSTFFGDPAPGSTEKQCYVMDAGQPFDGNIAVLAEASTSYVSPWENLNAINDGVIPSSSTDKSNGVYGNWNNPNSFQWVQYNWEQEYYITSTDVYWFTDNGGLLIPNEAFVEYHDGSDWVKWDDIGVERDQFNELSNAVIHTDALKLTFKNYNESTGITEWRVYGTVKDPSSITENDFEQKNNLDIYPNPSKSSFTIALKNNHTQEDVSLSILDMDGSEVFHSIFPGDESITLNKTTHGLTNSMYIVKVENKGLVYTGKLMVL